MGESERIEREAAAWLARRDRGDWSPRDELGLAAWCDAATAHRIAYLRLDAAWHGADRLKAVGAGVDAGTVAETGLIDVWTGPTSAFTCPGPMDCGTGELTDGSG